MIEIKNMHFEKPSQPFDIRVDRESVLGNPFYMKDESFRDDVCDKYIEYFNKRIKDEDEFIDELRRLYLIYKAYGRLRLFCWCAPKRCHAETIKNFLDPYVKDL